MDAQGGGATLAEQVLDWIQDNWRGAVEILILWILIYQLYRAFRATRGARILVGLAVVFIVLTLTSQFFHLEVIGWIITRAAALLAVALLIIFQPELRNALARLGSTKLFSFSTTQQEAFLETLADSVRQLSKKRFGALFAIERHISLENHTSTGVQINSDLSVELCLTIFHPKTALHDGGVVLSKERVVAAACVFPVSQKELQDRSMGLRHRAGLGLSEETDAVTIVVSEETGSVSICLEGAIYRNLNEEDFRKKLADIFLADESTTEKVDGEELDGEDRVSASGDRPLVSD